MGQRFRAGSCSLPIPALLVLDVLGAWVGADSVTLFLVLDVHHPAFQTARLTNLHHASILAAAQETFLRGCMTSF